MRVEGGIYTTLCDSKAEETPTARKTRKPKFGSPPGQSLGQQWVYYFLGPNFDLFVDY